MMNEKREMCLASVFYGAAHSGAISEGVSHSGPWKYKR